MSPKQQSCNDNLTSTYLLISRCRQEEGHMLTQELQEMASIARPRDLETECYRLKAYGPVMHRKHSKKYVSGFSLQNMNILPHFHTGQV